VSGSVRAHVTTQAGTEFVEGSHLLVAVGRRPTLSDLNLDAAGIKHGREGIAVNRGLRTSTARVYAIGDVTGGPQYTHVSDYHAGIVLRRALFWASAKADPSIISWATFTDPELAQAGLTEAQARAAKHKINVLRWPFVENDRAQTDRETVGHVKVITTAKGQILGATIVGARAGELIQVWALAVSQRLNIEAMTGYVTASPTLGEASRRAALRYYATTPAKPSVRKLIDFLAKLG
jgi:pyruvate/2-oxoglutarate dehydrogenase complex dihydrolipoamide dehydrogenase (E3) component